MRRDELGPGRASPRRLGDDGTRGAARPGGHRLDRGQSTVELALVLPVVLTLALALVQVGLVVRDQVRVTHAAREGARAAAVSADPGAPRQAVDRNVGLAADRLEVSSRGRGAAGSHVTVSVRYLAATDLPLVGALLPDLELSAAATMRVEQ
jgi:hypothetical protein